MTKQFSFLVLLFTQAAASAAPQSNMLKNPFRGVCENTVFLDKAAYAADAGYWDAVKLQCKVQVQTLPETAFLSYLMPKMSEAADQEHGAEFLQKMGIRAGENIEFNNKVSELWVNCAKFLDGDGAAKDFFAKKLAASQALAKTNAEEAAYEKDFYDSGKCSGRIDELKGLIAKKGKEFRIARETMRQMSGLGSSTMSAMRKGTDATANKLGLDGIILPGEKVPLSKEEQAFVDANLKEGHDKVRAELLAEANAAGPRLAQYVKDNPRAPLETIENVPHWIVQFYKSGGARGLDELPVGAEDALEIATLDQQMERTFPKAFEDFTKALGDARIVGFLDKRDPTNADIARAAKALWDNGLASLKDIKGQLSHGPRVLRGNVKVEMTAQDRIDRMKTLMQNGPVLRELLTEHPEDCAIAAGIQRYIEKKSTRDGVAIAVALAATGVGAAAVGPAAFAAVGWTVSGAAISTTVGVAAGGGTLLVDYARYQRSKTNTFSLAHTDESTFGTGKSIMDVDEYWDARNAFVINAAITVATTAAPVAHQGTKAGYAKLMGQNQSKLQTQAVLKALMDKKGLGLTESQAKQLLRDLASPNKATAQAAIAQMAKALHVSEGEINLFAKAVQKQMLDPNSQSVFVEFSKRLNAVKDPAERQVLLTRLNEVMDGLKEVGPAKRSDAMRVVLAASEFGAYDSSQVKARAIGALAAAKINEWDEGLYGLARTYEQARTNLALPEIARLAADERLEAAYSKALDDLGVTDPATKKKMTWCAFQAAK